MGDANAGKDDNEKIMQTLREYIAHCEGGDPAMVAGWCCEVATRSVGSTKGTKDVYYRNPNTGKRYRSRTEIARSLGLTPPVRVTKPKAPSGKKAVVVSREVAFENAVSFCRTAAIDLHPTNPERAHALPVKFGALTVHNLGAINPSSFYHTKQHIFPPGFVCTRLDYDSVNEQVVQLKCEIITGDVGTGPIFRMTVGGPPKRSIAKTKAAKRKRKREDDNDDEDEDEDDNAEEDEDEEEEEEEEQELNSHAATTPPRIFEGKSTEEVWNKVVQELRLSKSREDARPVTPNPCTDEVGMEVDSRAGGVTGNESAEEDNDDEYRELLEHAHELQQELAKIQSVNTGVMESHGQKSNAAIRRQKRQMDAYQQIVDMLNAEPDVGNFFNLSVERMIEGMPGAAACLNYIFHEQRGLGILYFDADTPMERPQSRSKSMKLGRSNEVERDLLLNDMILGQGRRAKVHQSVCDKRDKLEQREARRQARLEELTRRAHERVERRMTRMIDADERRRAKALVREEKKVARELERQQKLQEKIKNKLERRAALEEEKHTRAFTKVCMEKVNARRIEVKATIRQVVSEERSLIGAAKKAQEDAENCRKTVQMANSANKPLPMPKALKRARARARAQSIGQGGDVGVGAGTSANTSAASSSDWAAQAQQGKIHPLFPRGEIGTLLQVWDFLHNMSEPLKLAKPPTLEQLSTALVHSSGSSRNQDYVRGVNYLADMHIRMIHMLLPELLRWLKLESAGATVTPVGERPVVSTKTFSIPLNRHTWTEVARSWLTVRALRQTGMPNEHAELQRAFFGNFRPGTAGAEHNTRMLGLLRLQILSRWTEDERDLQFDMQKEGLRVKVKLPNCGSADKSSWQYYIHKVKRLPTNNGGKIRAEIEKAIDVCDDPGVKAKLRYAISPEIYKGNAAGKTKTAALRVLEEHTGETFVNAERRANLEQHEAGLQKEAVRQEKQEARKQANKMLRKRQNMNTQSRQKQQLRQRSGGDDADLEETHLRTTQSYLDKALAARDERAARRQTRAAQIPVQEAGEGEEEKAGAPNDNGSRSRSASAESDSVRKPVGNGKVDDFAVEFALQEDAPENAHRCLQVLIAILHRPDAQAFAEPVDPGTHPSYYESVAEPMALTDIGERLVNGTYLVTSADGSGAEASRMCVDDFAADMRAVWNNALFYFSAGTRDWLAAMRCASVFERLLLDWVLDCRRPELAQLSDENCSVCQSPENQIEMLLCDRCDHVFHLSCLDPPLLVVPSGDWFCSRCVARRDPTDFMAESFVGSAVAKDGLTGAVVAVDRSEQHTLCRIQYTSGETEELTCAELVQCVTVGGEAERATLDAVLSAAGHTERHAHISLDGHIDPVVSAKAAMLASQDSEYSEAVRTLSLLSMWSLEGDSGASIEDRLLVLKTVMYGACSSNAVRSWQNTLEERALKLRREAAETARKEREKKAAEFARAKAVVQAQSDSALAATLVSAGEAAKLQALSSVNVSGDRTPLKHSDCSSPAPSVDSEIAVDAVCEQCLYPSRRVKHTCSRALVVKPELVLSTEEQAMRRKHESERRRQRERTRKAKKMLRKHEQVFMDRMLHNLQHEEIVAAANGGDSSAAAAMDIDSKCELCGLTEIELCSPFVHALTIDEWMKVVKSTPAVLCCVYPPRRNGNVDDRTVPGLRLSSQRGRTPTMVEQYDLVSGTTIKVFLSGAAAADELNIAQPSVSQVCNGKLRQAGGFGFRFLTIADVDGADADADETMRMPSDDGVSASSANGSPSFSADEQVGHKEVVVRMKLGGRTPDAPPCDIPPEIVWQPIDSNVQLVRDENENSSLFDTLRAVPAMGSVVAHELCANFVTEMRAMDFMRKSREEDELEMMESLQGYASSNRRSNRPTAKAGTRTLPLGTDRRNRLYWRFLGHPTALFVQLMLDGPEYTMSDLNVRDEEMEVAGKCGKWYIFESAFEVAHVLKYLNPLHPNEAALRSTLLLNFPDAALAAASSRPEDDGYVDDDPLVDDVMDVDQEDPYREGDSFCQHCGNGESIPGNEILMCDGTAGNGTECSGAAHIACLGLSSVPSGDWLCHQCSASRPNANSAQHAAINGSGSVAAAKFEEKSRVLVRKADSKVMWSAIVMSRDACGGSHWRYRVNYVGWSTLYDEWVDESDVLPRTDQNLDQQSELWESIDSNMAMRAPDSIQGLRACAYLSRPGRNRGDRRGPSFPSAGEAFLMDDLDLVRLALLTVEAALPLGALTGAIRGGSKAGDSWNRGLAASWLAHVNNAETAHELAEALMILEAYLTPNVLQPWWRQLVEKSCVLPLTQFLRNVTTGSVAYRLYLLDSAIRYGSSIQALTAPIITSPPAKKKTGGRSSASAKKSPAASSPAAAPAAAHQYEEDEATETESDEDANDANPGDETESDEEEWS